MADTRGVVTTREKAGDPAWVARVEDAVCAEFHRIAAEVTGNDVPSRALRQWAKTHARGDAFRTFAKDIAQTVAAHPDVKAAADPTDEQVQTAVRNVITLLGSPGRS